MYKKILEEARSMQQELEEWRKKLHQIPETGLDLPKTSAFIQRKLNEMGILYQVLVNGSCVVGVIGSSGPCILLRADMDALPGMEDSRETFAAMNGCMHACGHDLHAASLLGAAKILKEYESELKGQVKLLFQPGEEVFKGAKAAIEEGVLESPVVNAVFGTHAFSQMPVGMLACGETTHASVYGFKIRLTGKGCHGAMSYLGIDPITTSVHIQLALQELLARECASSEEVALSIGQISAGVAANIIPETAELSGTLRTFENKTAERLIKRIEEMTRHIAAAYRTKAEIEVLYEAPVMTCNMEINALALNCAERLGIIEDKHKVMKNMKSTGSDDCAYFANEIPTGFIGYGAGVGEPSKWQAQHNPKARFSSEPLCDIAALYAATALEWLNSR